MSKYIDTRRKLFRHLDRVAGLKGRGLPPPVNVEIDLCNRCDRGCRWCHFSYTHTRGPLAEGGAVCGDLMEVELALGIIKQLEGAGVRSITWSGGGEPTLHPHFDQIVSVVEIDQGLYTHGGHINEARGRLLKRKLKWVCVSLDCVDAASYARYKQVPAGRFEEACQGVRNLAQAEGEATVGVGFLLSKDNWGDVLPMIDLGRMLGADYIQFRPAILYDRRWPGRLVGDIAWIDMVISDTLAWCKHHQPDVEVDISRFEMYRDWEGHGYETCWWSGLQTVITPDGKVWGCVNKRGLAGAEIGDLTRQPFGEIWQAAGLQGVNGDCRVMCRGHIANLALDEMMDMGGPHGNFI